MFNDINNAIFSHLSKYKITHVSMSHNRTRLIVDMDVDIFGFGPQQTSSHILIEGNEKDIIKNKWTLTRVHILNRRLMRDERIILSEKTKKEIWDFVSKEIKKVSTIR